MKIISAVSARALSFLAEQRLPPLPRYYALGFAYCDGSRGELVKAIDGVIDGGVRLTKAAADELCEAYLGNAGQSTISSSDTGSDALRHHTLRLGDLAASATAVTGEFSRELAEHIDDIAAVDPQTLQELFVVTLERSRRSERELAATTAQVNQLRQKLEEAQGDAERDALTGLPNRRGIEVYLSRIDAEDVKYSVAICDIDRFKTYNDRYGHAVGDRVLKTVSSSLVESLGEHFVGRWGGEEFLIVAKCDAKALVSSLENAKDALANRQFKLRETDEPIGRISYSAGVANVCREIRAHALEMADAALYRAKEAGRDMVLAA